MRRTRNTLYLSAARLLGQAVSFFTFPLILGVLGKEGWGVCTMLMAFWVFIGLVDLGIGDGLSRMLIAKIGAGDVDGAKAVHRTLDRLLWIVGCIQLVIFGVLALVQHGSFALYMLAGCALITRTAMTYSTSWFAAHHDFRDVAIANVINNLVTALGSLALVFWLRRPEAIFLGWTLAGLGATAYTRIRLARLGHLGGSASMAHAKEASIFGRKFLISKIAVAFAMGSDKLAIQNQLGAGALGAYSTGCRLPEAGSEVLPLFSISGPEMIQAREKGPEAFAHSVNHNLRMALLVVVVALAIPCSFGSTFGRAWLGTHFAPEIGWTMVLMGSYYAMAIFGGVAAQVIMATGKVEQVLPFTIFNGAVTLLASPFVAMRYGIVGVAVMNLGINLVQFVPLMAVTLRMAMDGPETRRTLAALSGTLLIGVGAVSAGVALSNWLVTQGWNWGFLVGAPLLMVVVSAAVVGLGLSPMPHLFSRIKALGRKV